MAVGPQGGAAVARRGAVDVLAVLAEHPALANDTARVVAAFLDDGTSPQLVETLLALQGTGVLHELVDAVPAVQRCIDARAALAP